MTKAIKHTEVAGTTPANNTPALQEAKRRPLKTLTIGDISASVWHRDHEIKGQPTRFYSVSFERGYRDSAGKRCYSRSFNPDDLGALMALCQQADEYIDSLEGLSQAAAAD